MACCGPNVAVAPSVAGGGGGGGAPSYLTGRQCIGTGCWDSVYDTPEPFLVLEPVSGPLPPIFAGAPWLLFFAIGVGIAYLYSGRRG